MTTQYIVRHGIMRFLGDFEPLEGVAYARGDEVVVRSDRGQEVGQVLCPASPQAIELLTEPTRGQIVRPLSADDHQRLERLKESERKEFDACRQLIAGR